MSIPLITIDAPAVAVGRTSSPQDGEAANRNRLIGHHNHRGDPPLHTHRETARAASIAQAQCSSTVTTSVGTTDCVFIDQNAQRYAAKIQDHAYRAATTDVYTGVNYRALATFLNEPYTRKSTDAHIPVLNDTDPPLVYIRSLFEGSTTAVRRAFPGLAAAAAADAFTRNPPALTASAVHLVWMQGFPAAEWINAIGAQYRVDPEFFRRYLLFLQTKDNYELPAMPSSTMNMMTIRLTTICRRTIALSRHAVDQARADAADALRRHQRDLIANGLVGHSIVRKYTVLDSMTFTIEQDIAIYVKRRHNGWVAIVCSDLGKDSTNSRTAPWRSDPAGTPPSCQPVIVHTPRLALQQRSSSAASHLDPVTTEVPDINSRAPRMVQNAALLPDSINLLAAGDPLRRDARDALADLFAFTAAAECQFLNMLTALVERELAPPPGPRRTDWMLANLHFFKAAADEHVQQLETTLAFLRLADPNSDWTAILTAPRAPNLLVEGPSAGAPAAVTGANPPAALHWGAGGVSGPPSQLPALAEDYAHLITSARRVSKRCVDAAAMLMNAALLEESHKAILQAKLLLRLTLLAFIFLPLSLTTSIFGMNFQEFGTGSLRIWVYFVVAAPILGISFLVCFWDWIFSQWLVKIKWKKPRKKGSRDLRRII